MLNQLRQGVASWIVKIMLGLLVLSFAAWGIGDMLRIRTPTWIAQVGDREIGRDEVMTAFRREVQRFSQMLGRSLDNEQARQAGLLTRTVKQLVGGALLDEEAQRLGLDIGDDTVRWSIENNPAFRSQFGQFDRLQFEQLIRQLGFTEKGFVQTLRRDLVREHLQSTVAFTAALPADLAQRLYRYQMEKRVAELLVFRNAAEGEVGEPDEAALVQFHKDHADRFTQPEMRALSVVELTAPALAKKITPSDAELHEEYENRLSEFSREEKRDLQQIVVADEAKAKEAHDRLVKGEDFATVAKELANLSPADITFDDTGRRDLPGELGAKVFALAPGALSEPIKDPLGWHVVKVKSIKPGGTDSFEQVKDKLREQVALARAGDQTVTLSRKLEDELAGGASLEDAAAKFDLPVEKIAATDARGQGPDGKPAAGLPDLPEVLQTAFATQPGAELRLNETTKGGYFVLRVDGVTPPTLKPLEQVKSEVVAAWKEDRRDEASAAKAAKALEKANAGASLEDLAKQFGGELKRTAPVLRNGQDGGPDLSPPLLVALFTLGQGQATTGVTGAKDGHVVARVAEIKPADPAADPGTVERLRKSLTDAFGVDLLEQFNQQLEKRYPVKIDEKALESLF